MNESKLLAYLTKEIAKTRDESSAFLAAGRASDFAEYRHVCGLIRGLNAAEQLINDLVQRLEKDDD